MGCSQSKLLSTESSQIPLGAARAKPRGTTSSAAPMTRDRIDSWAVSNGDVAAGGSGGSPQSSPIQQLAVTPSAPPVLAKKSFPPSAAAAPSASPRKQQQQLPLPQSQATATVMPTVESQWKFLWETHSPHLLDPADVHSVLDALQCRTINKLSVVDLTLLQRRVRMIVRNLTNTAKPTRAVTSVFANTTKTETESLSVVEKHHLLTESLIAKILPTSFITHNAYQLMLHMSESLWDRVANVAVLTATKAKLEMDVNVRAPKLRMPKPSVVPEVSPLADLPPGVTLQSLTFMVAMAQHGTRQQKLLLLFYLLVDKLGEFLDSHPAGGVPTWLLEADHETVISLASLTHYHYYGHGNYLPVSNLQAPPFCASSSRQPLTIQKSKLRELIQSTILPQPSSSSSVTVVAAGVPVVDGHAEIEVNGGSSVSPSRRNSKTSQGRAMRRSSDSSTVHAEAVEPPSEPQLYPNSLLMKRLAAVRELNANGSCIPGAETLDEHVSITSAMLDKLVPPAAVATSDALEQQYDDNNQSPQQRKRSSSKLSVPPANCMTLQQFATWAEEALDNATLAKLMHQLFTTGILPTAALEKDMVQEQWHEWQIWFDYMTKQDNVDNNNALDVLTRNVTASLQNSDSSAAFGNDGDKKIIALFQAPWGGIGGLDGGGALGYGVMYCIDKHWWDEWTSYVGWSILGERPSHASGGNRPGTLLTERLLLNQDPFIPRGSLGSYEHMRYGLQLNIDYVVVPSCVWDVLYELYGGGPPLPRIVKAVTNNTAETTTTSSYTADSNNKGTPRSDELDSIIHGLDSSGGRRVTRLPDTLTVAVHPWIIHVYLCDPSQPYRRGVIGLNSIRVMTLPNSSLWRLLAEVVVRFPLHAYKAFGADNRGKGRLWRKCEQKDVPATRYGPWNLVSKGRHASIPFSLDLREQSEQFSELVSNWKEYAEEATVESAGFVDGDHVMFEFAVFRNAELVWPREAAAKAGKARRLAEEDASFRAMLQGLDEKGSLLLKPAKLRGLTLDAMDSAGRWYAVTILEVDIIDEEVDHDGLEGDDSPLRRRNPTMVAKKKVSVDFTEHGGHQEWIDVESDRLAMLGRFTAVADDHHTTTADTKLNGSNVAALVDVKSKSAPPVKKALNEPAAEVGKVCLWPGFGACGLTNLGNTCYSNASIQCMSYLPVLRSYLLSGQYKTAGDLNKDNPIGTGGKLLEEFADLVRMLWSGRGGEKSPSKFRAQLGKLKAQFAGADQQDTQEFLIYILDMLHEDSNKVRKKPMVEGVEDDWVKSTGLSRVGDEALRRFLRRSRSIMTDVAMGQELNTVTCPVCSFTSKKFESFNLLSVPIPTVAEVIFKCTVFRRATAMNCPWVLDRPRRGNNDSRRLARKANHRSETCVAEEYILAMSRLADLGDIRLKLQNACGIPAHLLRLCRVEEHEGETDATQDRRMKITLLVDKDAPCSQLARKLAPGEKGPVPPTNIVAFESTLRSRPILPAESKDEALEDTADEDEEQETDEFQHHLTPSLREQAEIETYIKVYGDDVECRLVDTNPLVIAKAVSRSLWPQLECELKVGLRVDAKDQRGNWFPGAVIELLSGDTNASKAGNVAGQPTRVRVHFDNFGSKWDEHYKVEDFNEGRVRPLYAHSIPRPKPTEFLVYHRRMDRITGEPISFGHPFYVQCHNDWSNARAGAHILAQASRFLCQQNYPKGPIDLDVNTSADTEGKVRRAYERTQSVVSDMIDLLIACDREYIRLALGISEHNTDVEKDSPFRNPSFDPITLSGVLGKKLEVMQHKLPFELRVGTLDGGNGDTKEFGPVDEVPYPFTLVRTIGNYLNAKHHVILQWREPPVDRKAGTSRTFFSSPVMYSEPIIFIDQASARDHQERIKSSQELEAFGGLGQAGIDLGVCLTQFCKVQSLPITENWRCPRCKEYREGQQSMNIWRFPDLLTIHIKRFNMSARWREKITTKVNFPLTGLDMSKWFHTESPLAQIKSDDSNIFDLIGVVNHYGSMTGGHYVATCKATACGREGQEEVAYSFNGAGALAMEEEDDTDAPSGWRIGRSKAEVNQGKVSASIASRAAAESAEPLWLQFDDELVEPIAPEHVVSDSAYVLFYRRRRLTTSNVAKYSTLN
ncbi:hypothetical protein MPSEU_000464900 [Mayamaea pseudoterrestris]|nr:hypothetical protein MPSEU_000464900 [Mayamaea pseudoterrestris]